MRDLNLKEMMNSRESHPILKALQLDVDEIGGIANRKDNVDILISRINSGKDSVHKVWRDETDDFDLDKIKRIILGIERDGKVNLIVKQIIKEYKNLVNARSRGITFRKENLKGSETKFELIPFENILDDYLQQRQEIRDAKRIKRYSKPAGTGLTAQTENTLLRITLDEHKATIAQKEKKIEEFERVIVELKKAIEGRSKTITLLRDKLDEQDIELAYTNQQLKKAERQREQDQQQLSLFKAFASGFEKKNAELQQDAKQKETNIHQLNSQIKDIKEKYFQRKKENKELQEEIEKLRKINNTQQDEITQLRQEAETADLFLSVEEAETIAKMRAYGFKGTNKELLDSIRHEEEIMTIEALESKNRELVQKMNELLEEKGNTTVKIEDIIKGLKKIPNPVEQLLVMEKLGFYVFVNTPLGEQIRELIEEMCKNQQEIQNKQNIMINQLVTGNGTQNITNANMG
ncbi:hypothetical protein J5A71_08810 [Prevotella melaninogenica]|uniref:hypothetical protein n=1 Tax=Prevotella melaninogenica TaxID=28132 RepID=UPI001BA4EE1D|nr:hypothetical protein [Prevotella melaninogenica]QUB57427.1 hypothetical protein J5A72_08420 [Prevotella melaninogenica]QUB59760.1 hypothetical protein J5A71_08810 [Prevotella melaninogenica]